MLKLVALVVVGLSLSAAVAWNAAEAHYRGCLQAAKYTPPAKPDAIDSALTGGKPLPTADDGWGEPDTSAATEYKQVQACSRLPSI